MWHVGVGFGELYTYFRKLTLFRMGRNKMFSQHGQTKVLISGPGLDALQKSGKDPFAMHSADSSNEFPDLHNTLTLASVEFHWSLNGHQHGCISYSWDDINGPTEENLE